MHIKQDLLKSTKTGVEGQRQEPTLCGVGQDGVVNLQLVIGEVHKMTSLKVKLKTQCNADLCATSSNIGE